MDIEDALKILSINNEVSIVQLKKIYREFAKKYHPDRCESPEEILKINEAYKMIKKILENYPVPVDKILSGDIEERTFKRFKNDWLGGKYNE